MNPFDAYTTLEAHPGLGDDEIKQRHRDLSRRHHPDKEGGDSERFVQVQQAFALVRTAPVRRLLAARLSGLGELCAECKGRGVVVHRKGYRTIGSTPCEPCRRTGYVERRSRTG